MDPRQDLLDFFTWWKYEDVLALNKGELEAWRRHFVALREVGFYFRLAGSEEPHAESTDNGVHDNSGIGWC